ncbi:hypothetical protein BC833DRAFT_620033 [Globomyces pollinis-pini]|nr:hypothetical protein BC833DRAFT_620033 [Globomyces pollinis-pini]
MSFISLPSTTDPVSSDILGGIPLPSCPYPRSTFLNQFNPSVSFTYASSSIVLFLFGIVTLVHYNKVRIFNRRIKHPSVRNTEYACFYLFLAISFMIDAVRYMHDLPHQQPTKNHPNNDKWIVGPNIMDAWLLLASWLFRSLSLMFLTLALNQQRMYRSTVAATPAEHRNSSLYLPPNNQPSISDHAPLLNHRPQSYPGTRPHLFPINRWSHDETSHSDALEETERFDPPSDEGTPTSDRLPASIFDASKYSEFLTTVNNIFCWEFCVILVWILKLLLTLFSIDSYRLSDPVADPKSSLYSLNGNLPTIDFMPNQPTNNIHLLQDTWSIFPLISSIIQIIPLLVLTFEIVTTPALPLETVVNTHSRRTRNRVYGPSKTLKCLLLVSIVASLVYWLEISIVARILNVISPQPPSSATCIVPPWWWVERNNFTMVPINIQEYQKPVKIITHGIDSFMKSNTELGWASRMDGIQWIGSLSLIGIFFFMRQEYTRNQEDWIWVTVSEVQNTFDFRRY